MSDAQRLDVRTNLARSLLNTVLVRGYDMFDELVAEDPWSLVSIMLGGTRLDAEQCRILDMLGSIAGLAEPRIWPLKLIHLISTYGRSFSGIAAGYAVLDGAIIGPNSALPVALMLKEAATGCASDEERFAAIEELMDTRMAARKPVPGFGVVGREVDERWVAIDKWTTEHVPEGGPYWRMFRHGVRHMIERHGEQPNVIGPVAAFMLDFGLEPEVTPLFVGAIAYWAFAGNAVEGRDVTYPKLRRLPAEFVRYAGPAPRKSPRALAAEQDGDSRA